MTRQLIFAGTVKYGNALSIRKSRCDFLLIWDEMARAKFQLQYYGNCEVDDVKTFEDSNCKERASNITSSQFCGNRQIRKGAFRCYYK